MITCTVNSLLAFLKIINNNVNAIVDSICLAQKLIMLYIGYA